MASVRLVESLVAAMAGLFAVVAEVLVGPWQLVAVLVRAVPSARGDVRWWQLVGRVRARLGGDGESARP